MLATPLFVVLAGCATPVDSADSADTADTADSADTAEDTGNGDDTDPMVDSYVPASFDGAMPTRVVFLGDSITAGNGATKLKLDYVHLLQDNHDDEWPGFTANDFEAAWGSVPEIVDESVPGATTASLAYGQLDDVSEVLGDSVSGHTAVVMTIGGNDVQAILFTPEDTEETVAGIEENLAVMYDYFADTTRFPDGASIYLANVYEPSDGVGQVESCFWGIDLRSALASLEAVNAATRAQAEARGAAWIDMHGHFLGHGFFAEDDGNEYYAADDPTVWFDDDCIHPNNRGHHEIRRLFWHAMTGQAWPGDVVPE